MAVIGLTFAVFYGIACTYVYLQASLPTVEAMKNTELQVPLRVYARSGQLIAQIGEQRRTPVTFEQIPDLVRKAFIAAEDDRFFEHHGIDYKGVLRSLLVDIVSGRRAQGASTITMQTARNMYLTQDRKLRRKLQEIFLTMRLEREFSKEQILELYLNVIYFGQRSYGVAAAAETYFGKSLDQLTLAEIATLARIPQSPSTANPINNPEAAAERRGYVLRRMRELGFVSVTDAERAAKEVVRARVHSQMFEIDAPYVAEMARLDVIRRFGPEAQNQGYKVFTTIDPRLQAAANRALRIGLVEYDRRHGWRGAQGKAKLTGSEDDVALNGLVDEYPGVGNLLPAVVMDVAAKSARVFAKNTGSVTIAWDGMSWAHARESDEKVGPEPKTASEIMARGDIVYVMVGKNREAQLVQVPEAEGALVAIDPNDGAIPALVGGFDYFDKGIGKFNRATQARRQPGSGFKPFLYSAALENGFTAASVIQDAPIVIDDPGMEDAWRPENSSGEFSGPTRLREALVRSRNLVSIRILKQMGTSAAITHAMKFGFQREALPNNLTMALGTMQATPLEIASGFAVFANGGYRVQNYFIDRIVGPNGDVVYEAKPKIACDNCTSSTMVDDAGLAADAPAQLRERGARRGGALLMPAAQFAERAISAQNAWLMDDMMGDVIKRGTGRRALVLGRSDIAGKTGTTNDAKDTWFNGFNRNLVATVWVGFDQERSLGESEEGAKTAVPIWVNFMREALKNVPIANRPMPDGLVQMRISPDTGAPANVDDNSGIFETFMADHLPTGDILGGDMLPGTSTTTESGNSSGEPLF